MRDYLATEVALDHAEGHLTRREALQRLSRDIAGQNLANPTALLLSGLMMLRHIGEGAAADRVHAALMRVLEAGTTLTRDLKGTATTSAFTDAVCREIDAAA